MGELCVVSFCVGELYVVGFCVGEFCVYPRYFWYVCSPPICTHAHTDLGGQAAKVAEVDINQL